MPISATLQAALDEVVERKKDRLINLTSELIRLPSENCPPHGAEETCQLWLGKQLQACGLEPDIYTLDQVAGLENHPLYFAGRDYAQRPNLGARRTGVGGGKSLLLTGHIDTVPRGTQPWTDSPFSGKVEGNRIYGRGSNDMKAGVAMNLFAFECVAEMGLTLQGDLVFESVIDEEFGGCNGTLAGRLRGYNADGAILTEPSSLRICPAQRGGRTAHITLRAPAAGVLDTGRFPRGVIPQLTHFLSQVPEFAAKRTAQAKRHDLYSAHLDPVPVSVTKVFTSPWGPNEPITVPDTALVEFYWQLMPGERQADVEQEFFAWLDKMVANAPEIFSERPEISFPIRWLPGSAIERSEPLVERLSECAASVMGRKPDITGIEGPCDLFVLQQGFGIPAALWGPSGGNTHGADEYVDIDSLVLAAKTLLLFVADWCGVANH